MDKPKKYDLVWLSGETETVEGIHIRDALQKAGYDYRDVARLDSYNSRNTAVKSIKQ